jgi:hypothetical protein
LLQLAAKAYRQHSSLAAAASAWSRGFGPLIEIKVIFGVTETQPLIKRDE